MLPFIFRKGSNLKLLFQSGSRAKTVGIIFFSGFAGPLLLLAGLKTANAASVSIWLNMELVATAILGVMVFKDALDRNTWIGVVLSYLFVHKPFQWVHIISIVLLACAVIITNLFSHKQLTQTKNENCKFCLFNIHFRLAFPIFVCPKTYEGFPIGSIP